MKQFKQVAQAYSTLKIDESAKPADVKKAYLQLAKKYHPDKYTNAKDKEEAEKKFKELKEAYDIIVEHLKEKDEGYQSEFTNDEFDDYFSDFFKKPHHENSDDPFFDMNDFYHKYMYDEKAQPDFRERYIKDFEKYIKANKISTYDVYLDICNNKPIYKQKLGYHGDEMLMKESVYRTYIKSTPDFIKFKMNYKLVKDLDIHINLYYDEATMDQKNLNFDMEYEYSEVCPRCDGWGCNGCHGSGHEVKKKKLNVKIPKCGSKPEVILKEKGHLSPWKKGNIVIHLIKKPNLMHHKQKVDFYYEVKKRRIQTNKSVGLAMQEFASQTAAMLKTCYQFLATHKTHTIYISIITILVIIIILLACLL